MPLVYPSTSNSKLSNPASFSRLPLWFLSFLFPSLTWSMHKSCLSLAACLSLKTGGHPISFSTCIGLAITHSDILALMFVSNFLPSLPLFLCFPQLTTVPFFFLHWTPLLFNINLWHFTQLVPAWKVHQTISRKLDWGHRIFLWPHLPL